MRKLLRDEKVEREGGFYGGKERTYSQTETRIQTPGLGARNGVWNVSKPVREGHGRSLIQPPHLNARGVWNMRKLLRGREGGKGGRLLRWKGADPQPNANQNPDPRSRRRDTGFGTRVSLFGKVIMEGL